MRLCDDAMRKKLWLRVWAATSVVAVVSISFLSYGEKYALHTKGRLHPVGHIAVFCWITCLSILSVRSRFARAAVAIAAVLLGIALELGEHLFFGTRLEYGDIRTDCLGVVGGVGCAIVVRALSSVRPREN